MKKKFLLVALLFSCNHIRAGLEIAISLSVMASATSIAALIFTLKHEINLVGLKISHREMQETIAALEHPPVYSVMRALEQRMQQVPPPHYQDDEREDMVFQNPLYQDPELALPGQIVEQREPATPALPLLRNRLTGELVFSASV